ncbi:MAG TPA: Uma2 family endonuclease, partial [Polyangiaceae bacterium]
MSKALARRLGARGSGAAQAGGVLSPRNRVLSPRNGAGAPPVRVADALAWRARTDFYVGGNMFLYFSEIQSRKNDFRGPDVFVVTNTTRRERRAWVVWEEDGKGPDVVIELLSATTEKVDRGDKMRIYARLLKVGEYFLFDPFSGVFEGYELDVLHAGYVAKKPDARGRLRCEQLGLYLAKVRGTHYAVEADWLRW